MTKYCKDCKPDCLQEIPGGCLPYTGPEIECIDVDSAETSNSDLQENFVKLGLAFCQFIKDNEVNLGFLASDNENPLQQSYVGVKRLIDWATNLDTDDIGTGANLYCLADGISVSAGKIREKTLSWSTQSLSDGVNYTYNLSSVLESLPTDFTLNGVSVKANGNRAGSSRTLLASSTEPVGGFTLQPDNYPVNVTTEVRVGTPDGELILEKKVALTGNFSSDSYRSNLEIRDLSNNKNFEVTSQTHFNEIMASAYCHIKQLYESLKNLQISDCEFVQYADTHINTVIQTHSAKICDILSRLKNIGNEKITYKDCDDACGTSLREITLQEAFDLTGQDVCELLQRMKSMEARVLELELQIQSCCK